MQECRTGWTGRLADLRGAGKLAQDPLGEHPLGRIWSAQLFQVFCVSSIPMNAGNSRYFEGSACEATIGQREVAKSPKSRNALSSPLLDLILRMANV